MSAKNILDSFIVEDVETVVHESTSLRDVIFTLGMKDNGYTRKLLKAYLSKNNICTEMLEAKRAKKRTEGFYSPNKINDSDVFRDDSKVTPMVVLNRVIKKNELPYECSCCGNPGSWLGQTLPLRLVYKDGDKTNSHTYNLSLVCPNCKALGMHKIEEQTNVVKIFGE